VDGLRGLIPSYSPVFQRKIRAVGKKGKQHERRFALVLPELNEDQK
jgi:hypothetical protein